MRNGQTILIVFLLYIRRLLSVSQISFRDASVCGYTALSNLFYLFNNVLNFNVFYVFQFFLLIRKSHYLELYTCQTLLSLVDILYSLVDILYILSLSNSFYLFNNVLNFNVFLVFHFFSHSYVNLTFWSSIHVKLYFHLLTYCISYLECTLHTIFLTLNCMSFNV